MDLNLLTPRLRVAAAYFGGVAAGDDRGGQLPRLFAARLAAPLVPGRTARHHGDPRGRILDLAEHGPTGQGRGGGYQILAPITRRITPDEDDKPRRIVCGFRVVYVFDISQTAGDSLPDVGPRRLTGDGNARLLEAAIWMIEEQGYRPLDGLIHLDVRASASETFNQRSASTLREKLLECWRPSGPQ